jgi:hypothetical protein
MKMVLASVLCVATGVALAAGDPAAGAAATGAPGPVASAAAAKGAAPAGDEQRLVALRPYTARYKTTARGMALDLTRELKLHNDGSYTLVNGGRIMVAGFHEVSSFRVEGTRVVPKSYVYQGTGLINRRREVHFTPGSDTVRSLYKGRWYDLPYTDRTLDRMSLQEQLRLTLLNDPTPRGDLAVRVADGRKIKDYNLEFVAEETVETPLGALRTLHFERLHDDPERKSDIWVAPELDYLIVKTVHVEDGKPVEVTLTSASIDGVPVTPGVVER